MKNLTPMMQQYMSLKSRFQDSILFFRLGDFYEMFFEDALTASKELEITLTQRDCGMEEKAPMCGVPHHVSEVYISRLVSKGYKVAIAEQIEDPSLAKGIVKRDVIRVVTPGTITDSNVLDEKTNNYLTSIFLDDLSVGFSYVDNSTGEMHTTEYKGRTIEDNYDFVIDELGKIYPKEIICNSKFMEDKKYIKLIENYINPYFNVLEYETNKTESIEKIKRQFKVSSLEQLNMNDKVYSTISSSILLDYLYETQKTSLEHINNLNFYEPRNYMIIDMNTRANLELYETILTKQKKGALINVIDKTRTAMGGRLLKKWLDQPLLDIEAIEERQDMVSYYYYNIIDRDKIVTILDNVYDIERLASRVSAGNVNARDLNALKRSISIIPELKSNLIDTGEKSLMVIGDKLDPLSDIYDLLDQAIVEDPPISIKDGNLIKEGYNESLDKTRKASTSGKEWLSNLELKEKEATGIRNLKVGYNKVAGYFFEVTKANIGLVPDYFIRKQTLTNSERYYTEELKDMETTILGALEKSIDIEYQIFIEIREKLKSNIERIQKTSSYIAKIDVITGLASSADYNNFAKPSFNRKGLIDIVDGRHPVVEGLVENNLFVPNDTQLDLDKNMIQIITGPNMAGKSTYMRQVAIIVLLAHIGSFVPAEAANISIVDRIFTRIGAADNLSQGESTFMVEMNEVANIIRDASKDSLIILDEVGRGTSTYDGLSIAWAVVEYIASSIGAKTLFATHYHELTQLAERYDSISNLTISVEERGKEIIFLRKIVEGSTNKSYGIQVARLAGVNDNIIDRANQILGLIEGSHEINIDESNQRSRKAERQQLNMEDYKKDYFIDKISSININDMTPLEALSTLNYLVKDAENLKES